MNTKNLKLKELPRKVYFTPGAHNLWKGNYRVKIDECIELHFSGNWGDVCEDDFARNDEALENGARLFSEYKLRNENGEPFKLWIITESDRTITTALLATEY